MDIVATDNRDNEQNKILVGVKFRSRGQVFFFPSDLEGFKMGSCVLVKTEQGISLGHVCALSLFVKGKEDIYSTGEVIAFATAKDLAQDTDNHLLVGEASAFCKSHIRENHMDMKLVDVEVMHDRSKMIFYFTAPSRIDFRELVKELIRAYHTRIELRQVGVRHETQMVGGLGNCGRVCCCHSYLRTFAPVSIKMAKEQNLFLNPAKLSGLCGRLLCCLSFEQKSYEDFNKRSPKLGKKYSTSLGTVKVIRSNLFSESVAVLTESGEEKEFTLDDWHSLAPHRAERQEKAGATSRSYSERNQQSTSSPDLGENAQSYPEKNAKQQTSSRINSGAKQQSSPRTNQSAKQPSSQPKQGGAHRQSTHSAKKASPRSEQKGQDMSRNNEKTLEKGASQEVDQQE